MGRSYVVRRLKEVGDESGVDTDRAALASFHGHLLFVIPFNWEMLALGKLARQGRRRQDRWTWSHFAWGCRIPTCRRFRARGKLAATGRGKRDLPIWAIC